MKTNKKLKISLKFLSNKNILRQIVKFRQVIVKQHVAGEDKL